MTCPLGRPVTTFVRWRRSGSSCRSRSRTRRAGLYGVVFDPHGSVTSAGHDVIVGGVVSLTVIVCVQSTDVAAQVHALIGPGDDVDAVRRAVRGHVADVVTVTAPPQLSVAVTEAMFGAGTSEKHCTLNAPGQVSVGGVVSLTVIVCVQVFMLPHGSVALVGPGDDVVAARRAVRGRRRRGGSR